MMDSYASTRRSRRHVIAAVVALGAAGVFAGQVGCTSTTNEANDEGPTLTGSYAIRASGKAFGVVTFDKKDRTYAWRTLGSDASASGTYRFDASAGTIDLEANGKHMVLRASSFAVGGPHAGATGPQGLRLTSHDPAAANATDDTLLRDPACWCLLQDSSNPCCNQRGDVTGMSGVYPEGADSANPYSSAASNCQTPLCAVMQMAGQFIGQLNQNKEGGSGGTKPGDSPAGSADLDRVESFTVWTCTAPGTPNGVVTVSAVAPFNAPYSTASMTAIGPDNKDAIRVLTAATAEAAALPCKDVDGKDGFSSIETCGHWQANSSKDEVRIVVTGSGEGASAKLSMSFASSDPKKPAPPEPTCTSVTERPSAHVEQRSK